MIIFWKSLLISRFYEEVIVFFISIHQRHNYLLQTSSLVWSLDRAKGTWHSQQPRLGGNLAPHDFCMVFENFWHDGGPVSCFCLWGTACISSCSFQLPWLLQLFRALCGSPPPQSGLSFLSKSPRTPPTQPPLWSCWALLYSGAFFFLLILLFFSI